MRNQSSIILTGTADVSITGTALDTNQAINATFATIVAGGTTTAGTVKVQGSNQAAPQGQRGTFVPTEWSDIPAATATVTAGVAPLIVLSNVACQYMRVVFTRTAGVVSETVIVRCNTVGQ